MKERYDKRVKRRLPCELTAGTQSYRGITRNLSRHGMFVQTDATLAPGTEVDLTISSSGSVPRLELRAIVARRRAVPAILASAVARGVGLKLLRAPVEYGLAFQSTPLDAPVDEDAPEIRRVPPPAAPPSAAPATASERSRTSKLLRAEAPPERLPLRPAEIDATGEATRPAVVLLDAGDVGHICGLLRELGAEVVHVRTKRGGRLPAWRRPSRLLVASAKLALSMPLLSTRDGDDLVSVAVARNHSQTLSSQIRRLGFGYLVSEPVHPMALRLLFQQILFDGSNQRRAPRRAMGCRVSLRAGFRREEALLIDISSEGARLHTASMPDFDARVKLHVRRERLRETFSEGERFSIGLIWEELTAHARARLDALIELRAAGPAMLNDEPGEKPVAEIAKDPEERRRAPRGVLDREIVTIDESERMQHVLMGRDLSASGMRVDPHPELELGTRLRLALYVSACPEPLVLSAEIVREDGERGIGLAFVDPEPESIAQIEAVVAGLPAVERLAPRPRRVVLGRLMVPPKPPPPTP
jgi:hypothetical protein